MPSQINILDFNSTSKSVSDIDVIHFKTSSYPEKLHVLGDKWLNLLRIMLHTIGVIVD
jgi:hypothetical protein